jgi:hypothetical protein
LDRKLYATYFIKKGVHVSYFSMADKISIASMFQPSEDSLNTLYFLSLNRPWCLHTDSYSRQMLPSHKWRRENYFRYLFLLGMRWDKWTIYLFCSINTCPLQYPLFEQLKHNAPVRAHELLIHYCHLLSFSFESEAGCPFKGL